MEIRILKLGDKPSHGFIRRTHPVFIEFAKQMNWFTHQEWERNGSEGMVYVWVLKVENRVYERGVDRKRFCKTYRGNPINLESKV